MPRRKGTCSVCGIPATSRCGNCKVVNYCSREHQSAHFRTHKSACKQIKAHRETSEEEERRLRELPPDGVTWKGWDGSMGSFYELKESEAYMQAKYFLIQRLLEVNNETALEAALAEGMDCLRLNRCDSQSNRTWVLTALFRLRRYQQAYDFIMFWMDIPPGYDYTDLSKPYLNIVNAPILQDIDFKMVDGSMRVFVTLLMLKLRRVYLDYLNLYMIMPSNIPEATVGALIRNYLIDAWASRPLNIDFQVTTPATILPILQQLHKRILYCYLHTEKVFPPIWTKFENLEEAEKEVAFRLTLRPGRRIFDSLYELVPSFPQWKEAPYALEVILAINSHRESVVGTLMRRWKKSKKQGI
ncbi:hypothetical protein HDU96_004174 [Phlyctochytrium bullatum]|nr:hypothetical protein HDU96_004174 [Phlyctochytrium bullatum]